METRNIRSVSIWQQAVRKLEEFKIIKMKIAVAAGFPITNYELKAVCRKPRCMEDVATKIPFRINRLK